jgi:hypothetical protein
VITNLIDLEKHGSHEDLVGLIRQKLSEMKSGKRTSEEEATPADSAAPPAGQEDGTTSPGESPPAEKSDEGPVIQSAAASILL